MFEYFTKVGTNLATTQGNADYSSVAGRFITQPQRVATQVKSLAIAISDTDSTSQKIGDIAALTNGIVFQKGTFANGTFTLIESPLFHKAFKKNADFLPLFDLNYIAESGLIVSTKLVADLSGAEIDLAAGEVLAVYLHDDLSGLTGLEFVANIVEA